MSCKSCLPALAAGLLTASGVALPVTAAAGIDAWTDLGLPAGVHATVVATDPVDAATVYVGTAEGVLFTSTDAGATWTPTDLHQFDSPRQYAPVLSAVSIDPDDTGEAGPQIVVGADAGRIYRTHEGFWERDRIGGDTQTIQAIELGTGLFGAGAVAATSSGVWFTLDLQSGDWDVDLSWTVGGSVPQGCRHVYALAFDRQQGAQYAGTDCGLFKTTTPNEAGDPAAWQQVVTVASVPVRAIVLDPNKGDTLYVATDQGLWTLTAGGGTASLASGSGLPQQSAYALGIDPLTDTLLYAGLLSQGVYKGNPAATGAWLPFNPGLNPQGIRALAVSWPDPHRLYAVTEAGDAYGILQSHAPAQSIDLSVSYTAPPPASVSLKSSGGTFQATATVRNLGPAAARNVKFVLSFEKPGPLLRPVTASSDVVITSLQAGQRNCDIALATCALGTLSVGGTATVTFRVQPKSTLAGKRLTTVSTVGGVDVIWGAGDLAPANNQAKAYTNVAK
jgi:hypothetical protein